MRTTTPLLALSLALAFGFTTTACDKKEDKKEEKKEDKKEEKKEEKKDGGEAKADGGW